MSIWVSHYCQRQIGNIVPAALAAGIRESLDLFSDMFAQENPEAVIHRLRVEEIERKNDSQLLHLHYLEENLPIVLTRVGEPNEVSAEVEEYLDEFFQDHEGDGANLVRKQLETAVESFHFCLKQLHADGMGTPLVYAAASWLAQRGEGLLRVEGQGWMELETGEWFFLCDE